MGMFRAQKRDSDTSKPMQANKPKPRRRRSSNFIAASIEFSGRDRFDAILDGLPAPGTVISMLVGGKHSVLGLVESVTVKGKVQGKVVRRGVS